MSLYLGTEKIPNVNTISTEPYTLPVATETVLGGVKAIEKTETMTKQVGIDESGFLWVEAAPELVSIEIIAPPTKVSYQIGDMFDPAGMVVEALYSNGTKAMVSSYNYTFSPSSALSKEDTFITIQYSMNGVAATATQSILVKYYSDIFEDNDWETIIQVCQEKVVPDTWLVGDSKVMTIDATDYRINIIGKNHDDYEDGSGKAPLTFEMNELWPSSTYASGVLLGETYWSNWRIRTGTLDGYLNRLPEVVRNNVRTVNKTACGSGSSLVNVADKVFILSENEYFGEIKYAKVAEGTQYEFYAAGNSKIKKLNGSNHIYLTRSLSSQTQRTQVSYDGTYGDAPCTCNVSGENSGYHLISTNGYVAPAFCF